MSSIQTKIPNSDFEDDAKSMLQNEDAIKVFNDDDLIISTNVQLRSSL